MAVKVIVIFSLLGYFVDFTKMLCWDSAQLFIVHLNKIFKATEGWIPLVGSTFAPQKDLLCSLQTCELKIKKMQLLFCVKSAQRALSARSRSSPLFMYEWATSHEILQILKKAHSILWAVLWRPLHLIWVSGKYHSSCVPWKGWGIQST
jgi:hypothetical protein